MSFRFRLILLLPLFLVSCIPFHNMRYMVHDDKGDKSFKRDSIPEYKLQYGDQLFITIRSTVEGTELLDNRLESSPNGVSDAGMYINSYIIGTDGNIELPFVGKLYVYDLTITQATELIRTRLSEYLNFITLSVKLTSFRISVLGEVARPINQVFYTKSLTILQALSSAGDITDLGNRHRVHLIRRFNDKTEVHLLDLTKSDLISSPFYLLQPNDIIYVEPIKAKIFRSNANTVSLGISIITFSLLILSYTKILKR